MLEESDASDEHDEEDEDDDDDDDPRTRPDNIPDEGPLGLIANLSIHNAKYTSKSKAPSTGAASHTGEVKTEDEDENEVGVANKTYFMPGPATDLEKRASLIERHSAPEIILHGLVTPGDVDKLFEIFFEKINVRPFLFLLLHIPRY
jgi:hypothetical protein